MPDSLARPRSQGNETIREKTVADAIGAVEIKCGGACWNVDNAALGIERHPSPIVRGAAGLPRILRPRVIAKFARVRNGVKRPPHLSISNVIPPTSPGRPQQIT